MSKYNDEFKLKVVQEYLSGSLGYTLLAKKYDIPSETAIKNWVKAYQSFDIKGFMRKEDAS